MLYTKDVEPKNDSNTQEAGCDSVYAARSRVILQGQLRPLDPHAPAAIFAGQICFPPVDCVSRWLLG